MVLGLNHHRINDGDGVELCFFACLDALRWWSKGRLVRGYFCRMPACHRHGKTTNKRHMEGEHGRHRVGGSQPLFGSNRHHLYMVGSWLDLERVPMVLSIQLCQVLFFAPSFVWAKLCG